jgi:branched-chain amino acid aminotransferase
MKIYIDGKFYPKEEAKVSVFDHGYLYGDGIYETLRAYNGKVFEIEKHIKRLFQSAAKMALKLPLDENGFHKAITDSVRENDLKESYIRVSVSRGVGEIGLDLCPSPDGYVPSSSTLPGGDVRKGKVSVVNTQKPPGI